MSVDIGARQQGESVCYRPDGMALLATSEELPCPLIEVKRRIVVTTVLMEFTALRRERER